MAARTATTVLIPSGEGKGPDGSALKDWVDTMYPRVQTGCLKRKKRDGSGLDICLPKRQATLVHIME